MNNAAKTNTDPTLATNSVVNALRAKKSIADQRNYLQEMGFAPINASAHTNETEVIVLHKGTQDFNYAFVAIEKSSAMVQHYSQSTDTRNAEFYVRQNVPTFNYSHTGY